MSFLLDTNVVSEWAKPRPNVGIIQWLDQADEDRIFLSSCTVAELRYGVERLPDGRRRKSLEAWLHDQLLPRFAERILPIDDVIADAWGKLVAGRERLGRRPDTNYSFIAGTADLQQLNQVTRKTSELECAVRSRLNPWH